jgi:hypothetical protein
VVSLGSFVLTKQTDNTYLFLQSKDDSLIYRNPIQWNVSCKSIDKSILINDFPTKTTITSEKDIFRLSGYTAKNTAITGADSIIYQIQSTTTSQTKIIQKTMPGNSIQCNFTLSDLTSLDASYYGLLSITGYRVVTDMYSGKKYYVTFQQSTSKLVFVY